MEEFQKYFSRPLFTIIFRPEMLKFHPYFILTRETMDGFVIFCVLSCYNGKKSKNSGCKHILNKEITKTLKLTIMTHDNCTRKVSQCIGMVSLSLFTEKWQVECCCPYSLLGKGGSMMMTKHLLSSREICKAVWVRPFKWLLKSASYEGTANATPFIPYG